MNEDIKEIEEAGTVAASQEDTEALKVQKKRERRKFWSGFIIGVTGVVLVSSLFTWISFYRYNRNRAEVSSEVQLGTQNQSETVVDSLTMAKMTMIEKLIKKNYYKDVDNEKLRDGIYRGMLASLEDPYSEYYSKEDLKEVRESTEGIYYGIGAYVSLNNELNTCVISGVISGTPAEEANLLSTR